MDDLLSIFDDFDELSVRKGGNIDKDDTAVDRYESNYYLVCSRSAKLAKISMTYIHTYEQCYEKYCKIYGHLDDFHFIQVENGESLL